MNVIRENEKVSFRTMFLSQLKDFTFVLLFSASVISLVIAVNRDNGNWSESLILLVICALYALLGALRDWKIQAERLRLRALTVPSVTVLRGGEHRHISVEELVKGDIFFFSEGDWIPADGRLISADRLTCNESAIGCSACAAKDSSALLDVTAPVSERVNMVFYGSTVLSGSGCAIAVAVAMQTEAGLRSGLLAGESSEAVTPLKHSANRLQMPIAVTTVIICALIFIIGFSWRYSYGINAIESLLTGLALAAAVIPEVLDSLFTLAKTAGAVRLAEKHAVIRDISVMEKLANVTVICADKTGIFTTGSMEPSKLWTASGKLYPDMTVPLGEDALLLLQYSAICTDSRGILTAPEPTDSAVLPVLERYEIKKKHLDLRWPLVRSVPFDRTKRMAITIHRTPSGGSLIVAKGAPEAIIPLCSSIDTEKIDNVISQFGGELLRMIAVAVRELAAPPESVADSAFSGRMDFAGIIGLADPLRDGTREAAAVCARAGIRVIMTTGDHPATAASAAKQCGILRDGDELLTGSQLAKMTDDELNSSIRKYSVYARITPEDKLRIIRAWQNYNEVVAVTGLSVGDTAAVRTADVGFSASKSCTAVRAASGAVMHDGSLMSIARSVREGRTVCSNIRNNAKHMLQFDIGMGLLMVPGMIVCGTLPVLSLHLLIAALISGSLCSFGICTEPSYGESMAAPFIQRNTAIFDSASLAAAFANGFAVAALAVLSFFIGRSTSPECGRTMVLGTLILSRLSGTLTARMPSSGFRPGIRHSPVFPALCGASALLLAVCFWLIPKTLLLAPPTLMQCIIMAGLGLTPAVMTEILRLVREMRGKLSLSDLINRKGE